MTRHPLLSISLLSQLTDRDIQCHYLNHLVGEASPLENRTSEIADLLTQITDRDLALRIVNLAFEVDLNLGAELTASIAPQFQIEIVEKIDRLDVPILLKVRFWNATKSRAALNYLKDIFIFRNRQYDDYFSREYIVLLAIGGIINIDRDLGIELLIESLSDRRFCGRAVEILTDLAPPQAIEGLASLLEIDDSNGGCQGRVLEALIAIGNDRAISSIRDALYRDKSRWQETNWIQGLAVVADPAMVEQLIYMLDDPDLYIDREYEYLNGKEHYITEAKRLRCEAIEALERIGGASVFDWLHQAMYWISKSDDYDYYSPFERVFRALYRLDRERLLTALEGAIHSYDPAVKKRAAIALSDWNIPIEDRNLSILLGALEDIEDLDTDVQLEIVSCIRKIIDMELRALDYDLTNICDDWFISKTLFDRAILETKQILFKYASDEDIKNRDRVISMLLATESDEKELINKLRETISLKAAERLFDRFSEDTDLSVLLKHLEDPDKSICQQAVRSIVSQDNVNTYSTLFSIAANTELAPTLIRELSDLLREQPEANILKEFHNHEPLKFIEIAEQTLIQNIHHKINQVNFEVPALGAIGGEASVTALKKILDDRESYDDIDQAIDSLARIGSESALSILLNYLPDTDIYTGWAAIKLYNLGRLAIVPQLWKLECQSPSGRALEAIHHIQQKEGLYNPNFSDRVHQRFEPPKTRLRDILLGEVRSVS